MSLTIDDDQISRNCLDLAVIPDFCDDPIPVGMGQERSFDSFLADVVPEKAQKKRWRFFRITLDRMPQSALSTALLIRFDFDY